MKTLCHSNFYKLFLFIIILFIDAKVIHSYNYDDTVVSIGISHFTIKINKPSNTNIVYDQSLIIVRKDSAPSFVPKNNETYYDGLKINEDLISGITFDNNEITADGLTMGERWYFQIWYRYYEKNDEDIIEYQYTKGKNGFVITYLGGTLTEDLSLQSSNSPYILSSNLNVYVGVKLSINDNVIIKIKSNCSLNIDGTMIAQGSQASKIIFTSIKDDFYGGDSNNDLNYSEALPGDWDRITFSSKSRNNILRNVLIRYGGKKFGAYNSTYYHAPLSIETSSLELSYSVIEKNAEKGINILHSNPKISNNIIRENNGLSIYLNNNSLNTTFNNNSIYDNTLNGIGFSGTISEDSTLQYLDAPYIITDNVTIPVGIKFTIKPGIMIKLSNQKGIIVNGTIEASGTSSQKVYFTSIKDDTIGGDTNNDLNNSEPLSGDWDRLHITNKSSDCLINYSVFKYGGQYYYNGTKTRLSQLCIETSSSTITNCSIEKSISGGINISDVNPSIINNKFINNRTNAIILSSNINNTTIFNSLDAPYVFSGNITVYEGKTLIIQPGVIVKLSPNQSLTINGTLRAEGEENQKIFLTSLKNDQIGGDTNNDLYATEPESGDWDRLILSSKSSENSLKNVVINYGGKYDGSYDYYRAPVYIETSSAVIDSCLITNNINSGIQVSKASPQIKNCKINNNTGIAIILDNESSNTIILNNQVTNNSTNGIGISGSLNNICSWSSLDMPYIITDYVTVPVGVTLTINPGVIVKSLKHKGMSISGTLKANGLQGKKIYFTSINDDNIGGDTNNDLNKSEPSSGDWDRIYFSNKSILNYLKHLVVKYGGKYYSSGEKTRLSQFSIETSSLKLIDSSFEKSISGGINILDVNPTIQGNQLNNNATNAIIVSSNINSNVHWNSLDAPYVFSNCITISEGKSLTISPGVIVKMSSNQNLTVNGTLQANGLVDNRIIFTSLKDDDFGGDTNNDLYASEPKVGDWDRINFSTKSKNNYLKYISIYYGGKYDGYNDDYRAPIFTQTSLLTIENCLIEKNANSGIQVSNATPTIVDNSIKNNHGIAIKLNSSSSNTTIDRNTITNNSYNGIEVSGTINTNCTWKSIDKPYIVTDNITIPEGITLTIMPNVIIKFLSYKGLTVNGTLKVRGTSEKNVYLTSIKDDTIGGDTNNDLNATKPLPGDWDRIYLTSKSEFNLIEYTIIRYGGKYYSSGNKNRLSQLCIETSSLTLTNCSINNSIAGGIDISDVNPSIFNNTFMNNSINGIIVSKNIQNKKIVWDILDAPYVFSNSITISEGSNLIIKPGVMIKLSKNQNLTVHGSLKAEGTEANQIYITSLKDDNVGGDTNNDLYVSEAKKGDWDRIYITSNSYDNLIKNTIIRYGGEYYSSGTKYRPLIYSETSSLLIENCSIEKSANSGVHISNASPSLISNTFNNNSGFPILLNASASNTNITGNVTDENSINGIGISGNLSTSSNWSSLNMPYVVQNSVSIPEGITLSISQGVIIKFYPYKGITVNGTLVTKGSEEQQVYFTSLKDDSIGDDTNNDLNATMPSFGDWDRIYFSNKSINNSLKYAIIRYGGKYASGNYRAQIYIQTSELSIKNSTIERSANNGVEIQTSSPIITETIIRDNRNYGISTISSSPSISSCVFKENLNNAINNSSATQIVKAEDNYWGDPTGPNDLSDDRDSGGLYNPEGKGDKVSDNVDYKPWLYQFNPMTEKVEIKIENPNHYAVYYPNSKVTISWSSTNTDPNDRIIISMKRSSVSNNLSQPDNKNWYRFTDYGADNSNDGQEIVQIPSDMIDADDWRFYVRHVPTNIWTASEETFRYDQLNDYLTKIQHEEAINEITSEKNQAIAGLNHEITGLYTTISNIESENKFLSDEYYTLTISYNMLSDMYKDLSNTYTELATNFIALSQTNNALSINNYNLTNSISLLTDQYEKLSKDCNRLYIANIELADDYTSLSIVHQELTDNYYSLSRTCLTDTQNLRSENEILRSFKILFDIDNDNKIGLPEAVNSLKIGVNIEK